MTALSPVVAGTGAIPDLNDNLIAVSPAGMYGRRAPATSGLTWGFYGGIAFGATIANGTVALTASTTNYIVASRTNGVVSVATNTTNWNNTAAYWRLYQVVTGSGSVTSYIDYRDFTGGNEAASLSAGLSTANSNIASLSTGLSSATSSISSLSTSTSSGLSTAMSSISSLSTSTSSGLSTVTSGLASKLNTSAVGTSVAPLVSGLVPSVYLPSYVDDVLEFANLASFPNPGETGKIYTALDTDKIYRWSGSTYIEISPSPGSTDAVAEGSTNLYFTAARVRAAVLSGLAAGADAVISAADTVLQAFQKLQAQITAHRSDTGNPHATTKGQVGLGNVDNTSDANKPLTAEMTRRLRAPFVNVMSDSGRMTARANPLSLTAGAFNAGKLSLFLQPLEANAVPWSQAGKFIDGNTNNGGSNGVMTQTAVDLLTTQGRTGSLAANGTEYYIAQMTQGTNMNVASPWVPDGISRYLATVMDTSVQAVFAFNGNATATFWIRCIDKTAALIPAVLGGTPRLTYRNGVMQSSEFLVTPADGWVHVRVVMYSVFGYDTAFPRIYCEPGQTIQTALPGFFLGEVDTGIHIAPLPTINELIP